MPDTEYSRSNAIPGPAAFKRGVLPRIFNNEKRLRRVASHKKYRKSGMGLISAEANERENYQPTEEGRQKYRFCIPLMRNSMGREVMIRVLLQLLLELVCIIGTLEGVTSIFRKFGIDESFTSIIL